MHLLLAQKGEIADAGEAVDLGQTPADIVFLSAADTQLTALATAQKVLNDDKSTLEPSLRLANLMQLAHPMSLDLYIDRTARHAKLIIVQLLGGRSYWPYGVSRLHSLAVEKNIKLTFLPGDDKPDPELAQFSTLAASASEQLWHYLRHGGRDNATHFLKFCAFLLGRSEAPPAPIPLLKAGLWWPDRQSPDLMSVLQESGGRKKGVVPIIFYRALAESGQTAPVSALICALQARDLAPVPIFITSLKDELSCAIITQIFDACRPDLVLNATGFAASVGSNERNVLDGLGNMVLQVTFSSTPYAQWQESARGLNARDLAMNIALPEMDGRIFTRAISFKSAPHFDEQTQCHLVQHHPDASRVEFVADLAANWLKLRHRGASERHIALIMANYPGSGASGEGRLAHGVGLDTPAAAVHILHQLRERGYDTGEKLPRDSEMLMQQLMTGPTNQGVEGRRITNCLSLDSYRHFFALLPAQAQKEITELWGRPEDDAYFVEGAFALPLLQFGKLLIGLQPDRAHGMPAKQTYHAPDIVPSHHYMAFYFFLRHIYQADAMVHIGKHGNLEWLPGKSLALSQTCYPELALGPSPHIYPFIVNDPGEGTQAKRRAAAVIIDHMTPPLTRAETYGYLRDLEILVDEYYQASGLDSRRLPKLKTRILDLVQSNNLAQDAGISAGDDGDMALQKLDAFLCDLKELQIRDGLHIFGQSPQGAQLDNLLVALTRLPRSSDATNSLSNGNLSNDSLHRAIARDLGLNFDPLKCDMSAPWQETKPPLLQQMSDDVWRTQGDGVERIELLALALVGGQRACSQPMESTQAVLDFINQSLRPQLEQCGSDEINGLLSALDGGFVKPGPAGAPTRGRLDVLPTGRNFFSIDNRSLPTPAAWDLGARSAELMIIRYVQEQGDWPRSFALTAWGTANMRTGGDDIAQALALIGAKPVWDTGSMRVTGYEIVPLAKLGRPRVDVTLRISGFFRDAFPEQITLFDQAIRAIGALTGEGEENPIAQSMRIDRAALAKEGFDEDYATRQAGYRIFGARPGSYGTGMGQLIDGDDWHDMQNLGEVFIAHSSYAYGTEDGEKALSAFTKRLTQIEAIVQNQDNREHDLLDSGEYYAFEGGMAAAVASQKGSIPIIFHNDLSRPERPQIKTLAEELGRTLHARALNPKWIEGVMRHGFKGAAEMAATVDYLFAFAATTGVVSDAHFDAIYAAYLDDDKVRQFLSDKNPAALREIAMRLRAAVRRQLWHTRSNSILSKLDVIIQKKGEES